MPSRKKYPAIDDRNLSMTGSMNPPGSSEYQQVSIVSARQRRAGGCVHVQVIDGGAGSNPDGAVAGVSQAEVAV
ncbi:hypothetical protein [Nocardia sp. IFM 10818]